MKLLKEMVEHLKGDIQTRIVKKKDVKWPRSKGDSHPQMLQTTTWKGSDRERARREGLMDQQKQAAPSSAGQPVHPVGSIVWKRGRECVCEPRLTDANNKR